MADLEKIASLLVEAHDYAEVIERENEGLKSENEALKAQIGAAKQDIVDLGKKASTSSNSEWDLGTSYENYTPDPENAASRLDAFLND